MRLLSFFLFLSSLLSAQNEFSIDQISISGNKTTKDFIILRELPFSKNDKVNIADTTKLKDLAIQNLKNTNLFNQVSLSFHENKLDVNTASSLQVRKKIYQGSSDAWREYSDFLKPLIDALDPNATII